MLAGKQGQMVFLPLEISLSQKMMSEFEAMSRVELYHEIRRNNFNGCLVNNIRYLAMLLAQDKHNNPEVY